MLLLASSQTRANMTADWVTLCGTGSRWLNASGTVLLCLCIVTCIIVPWMPLSEMSSRYILRSIDNNKLTPPHVRLSTDGAHAFAAAATRTWNSLSSYVALFFLEFFRRLKTYLFALFCIDFKRCRDLRVSAYCKLFYYIILKYICFLTLGLTKPLWLRQSFCDVLLQLIYRQSFWKFHIRPLVTLPRSLGRLMTARWQYVTGGN